ncbi:hypothetical protein AMTR_s00004p00239360 [Amborella trichopoda]|uniref:Uncharacterized protein n=1 Tax=Amborella trichopoda TaxID=13333 RepID=W1NEC6_AMBTC|nr:hypothetical protein AMTR_s00004p00239360 [Amborella trichopoda]
MNPKTMKPIERPPVPALAEKSKSTKKTRSSSLLKSKPKFESLLKGKKKNESPSVATVSSMEYDVLVAKSKNPNIDLKGKSKWKESIPSPLEPPLKEPDVEGKNKFKNVEPEVPTFLERITRSTGLKAFLPRQDVMNALFFGNSTIEDPKGTLRSELAEKDELREIKVKFPLVDDDSMLVTTIHEEGSSSWPHKECFSLVEVDANIEVALKVLFLDQAEGAPLSTEANIPQSSPLAENATLKLNEVEFPEARATESRIDEVKDPPPSLNDEIEAPSMQVARPKRTSITVLGTLENLVESMMKESSDLSESQRRVEQEAVRSIFRSL